MVATSSAPSARSFFIANTLGVWQFTNNCNAKCCTLCACSIKGVCYLCLLRDRLLNSRKHCCSAGCNLPCLPLPADGPSAALVTYIICALPATWILVLVLERGSILLSFLSSTTDLRHRLSLQQPCVQVTRMHCVMTCQPLWVFVSSISPIASFTLKIRVTASSITRHRHASLFNKGFECIEKFTVPARLHCHIHTGIKSISWWTPLGSWDLSGVSHYNRRSETRQSPAPRWGSL